MNTVIFLHCYDRPFPSWASRGEQVGKCFMHKIMSRKFKNSTGYLKERLKTKCCIVLTCFLLLQKLRIWYQELVISCRPMKYEIMNIWKTFLNKRESYHHDGNWDAREGKGKHVVKLHILCDNFEKKRLLNCRESE